MGVIRVGKIKVENTNSGKKLISLNGGNIGFSRIFAVDSYATYRITSSVTRYSGTLYISINDIEQEYVKELLLYIL